MANKRKCKNCYMWQKQSAKFGKCPKIGRDVNLRFTHNDDIIFAMTPTFGVCDEHKFQNEIQ